MGPGEGSARGRGGIDETSGASTPGARGGDAIAETIAGPGPTNAGLEVTTAASRGVETSAGLDATTAPGESRPAEDATDAGGPALPRGSLIGRYVVLDRLGAGAMGVVFAAFDPELDRKVAIKLMQPGIAGTSPSLTSDARTRLVREAQALAKLNHPNVVAVFDAGTHADQVWIAMELVEGRTLRTWLAERRPGWRELLAVMQAAGRGLAAAHVAGLVHRDIKPDNIMIGDDGRVRVMDFGLARRGADRAVVTPIETSGRAMLAVEVTHAGAMVGTPAYMAPEQFRGAVVGPPADVFAFSVTLWEGLHGARPFAGATIGELRASVEAGQIVAPTRTRGVPRWLDAVLTRGLAADPGRRWPGMSAMLTEFERGQARIGRRRALLLAGGLAAVAGGIYGGVAASHQRTLAACEAEGAAILGDWSPSTRSEIERAFTATGKANAATVFARTTPWLDRWAASWQAARAQACVAHRVEQTLDDELHARAEDCLDEHRGNFVALVRGLGEADALTLTRATPAAAGLPSVEGCLDPATLRERPPLSPERFAEVTAIRERVARATSLQAAGKFTEGLVVAREAATAAIAANWPPAVAEAEYRLGYAESQAGDYAAAELTLTRALAAAREARAPRPALLSMTQLVFVVGDRGARFAEGKVWAEAARTELMHVAGDVRPLTAQLDHNLALVHHARGEYDAALRLNERALATWIEVYGEDHPQVAQSVNNLGNAQRARGACEQALPLYARGLAIRERALGDDHPYVAGSLSNIAVCHNELGHAKEALRLQQRALEIRERVLEPTHPDVLESLNNLANVHQSVGAHDEALRLYERALAAIEQKPGGDPRMSATILYNCGLIRAAQRRDAEAARDHARSLELFEGLLGKDHATLAYPLDGLAHSKFRTGDLDEALRLHTRALAVREAALGQDHPDLLWTLIGLALVERARGRLDEALRLGTRALALAEAAGGKPPDLVPALADLAETHLAARRPAAAITALERALPLIPPEDTSPEKGPRLRFLLARALWDAGTDRPRARALAEQAARDFSAAAGREADVQEIRAWLAARAE